MKININYDLLEKIDLAKTGFSINRTMKNISDIAVITESSAILITLAVLGYIPEGFFLGSVGGLIQGSLINVSLNLLISKIVKEGSISDLKKLSSILKCINVNTNYDLLLNSYKYETEYEFVKGNSTLPKLEQKKYIMVPVYDNGEEKEISLLQEHIVGTKTYTLSCGEPNKVLKLTPVSI